MLNPKLEILAPSQRLLWEELRHTPRDFVLYGGTAIALRLGHRQSDDFDFFSNEPFEPSLLLDRMPYLKDARVDQRGDNTLTSVVDRNGLVRVSFFGDLHMSHVLDPDVTPGNELQIASLLDLTATKLKTIQQRAEAKDYRDIAAALDAGVDLSEALAAGAAVYGRTFNPIAALKAMAYFEDGNLPSLPPDLRGRLRKASAQVKPERLPVIAGKSGIARETREK